MAENWLEFKEITVNLIGAADRIGLEINEEKKRQGKTRKRGNFRIQSE